MSFGRSLLRDEGGQATIEYILMLSIMVALIISTLKKILAPIFERAKETLANSIKNTLFRPGSMHSIPFRGN